MTSSKDNSEDTTVGAVAKKSHTGQEQPSICVDRPMDKHRMDSPTSHTSSPISRNENHVSKEVPSAKNTTDETNPNGKASDYSDIRYRAEYRSYRDHLLLEEKESNQGEKRNLSHEGPVIDVVDIFYTLWTKDTRKSSTNAESKEAVQALAQQKPPSVFWRGHPYIRIRSQAIINALQSVVNYYPRQDLVSQSVDIDWPYAVLIHHWDELKEFRKKFNDSNTEDSTNCLVPDTYRHLGVLLDFLEKEMGSKVRQEHERWKRGKASFDMLWLLLKPGTDVYEHMEEDGRKEPWVVSRVEFEVSDQAWDKYIIEKWYLDNDSTSIRPILKKQTIHQFHGEKSIEDLSLFPCEYFKDHVSRKNELVKRGQLFAQLQQKKCMYFEGESRDTPHQSYKGYVMVDPVQALEDMDEEEEEMDMLVEQKPSQLPLCSCARCSDITCERNRPAKFLGYKRIPFKDTSNMTEHQHFICPPAIDAFVLAVRQWKPLYLTGFKEPEWNLGLMESLVLESTTKKFLHSLCRLYVAQSTDPISKKPTVTSDGRPQAKAWNADYIDNKGKGLVVLLHGKPGVGKTYTAECIAHTMKRPLLSITCADIGVNPPDVEKNLRRWFSIARLWDAVLLIDEADIYFESRENQDLERNNLVASFLRVIEYYDGILFLTTNRIGTSDEAVWSRIHATIYYDDFTDDQRQKIWNTYFDKLSEERGKEIVVTEAARDYVETAQVLKESKWNGREIRNAFQIAVNLAQAEDSRDSKGRFTVDRRHIKVTVDLLKEFKDYMHNLHKKSASQRALKDGIRYDAYHTANVPREEYR